MLYNIQLAIYVNDFGQTMPISTYLHQQQTGEATWTPRLTSTTLLLYSQGQEWLARNWSLGSLDLLVLQLEAAIVRLNQGQLAIVRSAVDDEREVPYLLLDPTQDATQTQISLVFLAATPFAFAYPVPRAPEQVEPLYRYVQEHRSQLIAEAQSVAPRESFSQLPYPSADLITHLHREAELGRCLYERLGQPFRAS